MSQLSALKSSKSIHNVARLLGFRAAALAYVLYSKAPSDNYKIFEIPKRNGGTRRIAAPQGALKLIQRRLADLLQNAEEEIDSNSASARRNVRSPSHGFRRRRSIITNARVHRNKRFVFNVDIADFFGAINFGRVRGFFINDRNFALDPVVATILAQIVCFENALPQGSPCSPVVSNLIGNILDMHLVRLAANARCNYSRYADDMTFSTNLKDFPKAIAQRRTPSSWEPGKDLIRMIRKSGFSVNSSKTRMQYSDSRQEVTGLVVNRKVNVAREYRHAVRAMVHNLFETGAFYINAKDPQTGSRQQLNGGTQQLHGMLGYIDQIDLFNQKENGKRSSAFLSSKEQMYTRFLLFKEFYAAESPVLLCEGKTDNVYMTHAIRSMANYYPRLAQIDSNGDVKIKLRRFKYTGTSTGRLLGLGGGAPSLGKFIELYRKEMKRFRAPGLSNPIVILIDNDDGAKKILGIARTLLKRRVERSERFFRLAANLYVVLTPLSDSNGYSTIEDCFDEKTRSIKLKGRTFVASDEYDKSKCYGKAEFAYRVVEPRAGTIDFTGFRPLLNRIDDVLKLHEESMVKTEEAME